MSPDLCAAANDPECVEDGAAVLVFAALYERTIGKYGERGVRYVHMEVGHAAQNVYLQAVSLGLGTVVVRPFSDDEQAICIIPLGKSDELKSFSK